MTAPIGTAGTAGRNYRVPEKAGRHRAPPTPPRPDRFTVPIAAAAAILTCASLIALTAPAVAPDGRVAGNGATVSTAARTARTVHVPLTILPAPVPTIGAEGAWDPEATPSAPREAPEATRGVPRSPVSTDEAVTEPLTATTEPTLTTEPPAPATEATTTAPPAETTAATTTASATPTEEQPVPTETAEPTTDIGELIDQILEDAIGTTGEAP